MRYIILVFLVLLSCTQDTKTLPSCTGQKSELIFVVDDVLWEGPLKALIINVFAEEIPGINQPEPLFRIIQVNHKEFKSVLRTHTNVVIVSERKNPLVEENKWAQDQYVAEIGWHSNVQNFINELLELRSVFVFREVDFIRKNFLTKSQKNSEQERKSFFGVDCIIPQEYEILNNTANFFWANYNPSKSEEIKNIFTFSFISHSTSKHEEVLRKTDSLFTRHLKGAKKGTYVTIEPEYEPYYSDNIYRGLWKLEHGFMGGPFIIKSYSLGNKTIVNAGLVFAPQSRKRKYIKEFEAIL